MRKFRGGGAVSYRKALKAARKANITVEQKKASSLVRLVAPNGDQISISSQDRDVTRKTAAWLRDHGVDV